MIKKYWKRFWGWYERNHTLNLGIATGLFSLQLVHLFWLATHVIAERLFGQAYFTPGGFYETLIILVDYTEIPALITVSLVYINELRKKITVKPVLFLLFLNSQWIHILWITDEFVVQRFGTADHHSPLLPVWLALVAILIDYLELPVIFDTTKSFISEIRKGDVKEAFEALREE
jgi:hypothetical protein